MTDNRPIRTRLSDGLRTHLITALDAAYVEYPDKDTAAEVLAARLGIVDATVLPPDALPPEVSGQMPLPEGDE